MIDYDDLRKKAEAATAGPWYAELDGECSNVYSTPPNTPFGKRKPIGGSDNETGEAMEPENADYIATASPDVILQLLDIIDVAKRAIVDIAIRAGRGPEAISIIQIALDGLKNISTLEVDEMAKIENE